ncbi:hypothetical protein GCM10027265_18140 [Jatrophihabitans fulvus]
MISVATLGWGQADGQQRWDGARRTGSGVGRSAGGVHGGADEAAALGVVGDPDGREFAGGGGEPGLEQRP